jgi:hypothetical protein
MVLYTSIYDAIGVGRGRGGSIRENATGSGVASNYLDRRICT